jgi:hypothetical protein
VWLQARLVARPASGQRPTRAKPEGLRVLRTGSPSGLAGMLSCAMSHGAARNASTRRRSAIRASVQAPSIACHRGQGRDAFFERLRRSLRDPRHSALGAQESRRENHEVASGCLKVRGETGLWERKGYFRRAPHPATSAGGSLRVVAWARNSHPHALPALVVTVRSR